MTGGEKRKAPESHRATPGLGTTRQRQVSERTPVYHMLACLLRSEHALLNAVHVSAASGGGL